MKKLSIAIAASAYMAGLPAGCDVRPRPPAARRFRVPNVLAANPSDKAEVEAVRKLETARLEYKHRLGVLAGYYKRVGDLIKLRWARRETENLTKTTGTFRWQGIGTVAAPKAAHLGKADEPTLVEATVRARRGFVKAAAELAEFYERRDRRSYKARRVRNVQERFDPIHTYMYFLSAEIPGPQLKPTEAIPEADRMFRHGKRLFDQGKGFSRTCFTTDYQKMRLALETFRGLIYKYPHSTKIALAAYYAGEIYKEYFNEDVRAVHWYQRAWQWDKSVPEPARFQAATVWDIRLRNYTRAIECYRLALRYDPWRLGNPETARRRIRELTLEKPE